MRSEADQKRLNLIRSLHDIEGAGPVSFLLRQIDVLEAEIKQLQEEALPHPILVSDVQGNVSMTEKINAMPPSDPKYLEQYRKLANSGVPLDLGQDFDLDVENTRDVLTTMEKLWGGAPVEYTAKGIFEEMGGETWGESTCSLSPSINNPEPNVVMRNSWSNDPESCHVVYPMGMSSGVDPADSKGSVIMMQVDYGDDEEFDEDTEYGISKPGQEVAQLYNRKTALQRVAAQVQTLAERPRMIDDGDVDLSHLLRDASHKTSRGGRDLYWTGKRWVDPKEEEFVDERSTQEDADDCHVRLVAQGKKHNIMATQKDDAATTEEDNIPPPTIVEKPR